VELSFSKNGKIFVLSNIVCAGGKLRLFGFAAEKRAASLLKANAKVYGGVEKLTRRLSFLCLASRWGDLFHPNVYRLHGSSECS